MAFNKQKILKNAAKYTKKGLYAKAIAEYRKITQEEYGDSSINNVIGDLLLQDNRSKEAIAEYEKAGQYYENKGFIPKALAIYKKILRQDPSISRIYVKLAHLYSDQGLIQDAISQYEFLARHYEHEGKKEEALDAYRQIADLDPSNMTIRERLASLYAKQGFPEKACAERIKIGERYMNRGDTVTAIKNFEMALKEDPDNEAALRGIVSVFLAEKRTDEAVRILNKILEKSPDNISALSTLGRVYMDSGDLDQAIEVFNRVFKLDPSQEGVNEILGRIYILKGNYPEAFRRLKEIIALCIEREEYDRALGILDQLQEIEPNNILVREKKIEIYQKLNRDDDLRATFKDLAEIYYGKGRLEESYNIYERLFSMDPHDNAIKQRFNQISIELRGRPIEVNKLVEKPSFTSVLEESDVAEHDLFEMDAETFSLEEGANTLESLFDTREIEKISIPMFGEEEEAQPSATSTDEFDITDDIFGLESEEKPGTASAELEPSEDQLREFRIEAGVFIKYGLLEKAADRLKSILVIKPDDDPSLEKLAEVYEKMGQLDLLVQTLLHRAEIAERAGEKDAAAEFLSQALEQAPGDEKILKKLSELGVETGMDIPSAVSDEEPLVSVDIAETGGSDYEPLVDLSAISLEEAAPEGDATPFAESEAEAKEEEVAEGSLANGLADVVREFREELVGRKESKDVETHFNLGIAYREMGLVDEAIEEFKLTLDHPSHLIQGSDLLAGCYMEKGNFKKAISVLSRALKAKTFTDNEKHTLQYSLAMAKKMAGDAPAAKELFASIHSENPKYRDVAKQLKQL